MALAHAVLVSLMNCSCSGYDIAKQFDGSVGFFWKASHQQIYRELAKLEAEEWVSSETIPQEGRPAKKLYSVTPLGKQQLLEWIAQPSKPAATKEDILVKLFAGCYAPRPIILAELQRHRQAHLERLMVYQKIELQYFQDPHSLPSKEKFQYLTLRRGIGYETGWITWCEEAIKFLSENAEGTSIPANRQEGI